MTRVELVLLHCLSRGPQARFGLVAAVTARERVGLADVEEALARLVAGGLVRAEGDRVAITAAGYDRLVHHLVAAALCGGAA